MRHMSAELSRPVIIFTVATMIMTGYSLVFLKPPLWTHVFGILLGAFGVAAAGVYARRRKQRQLY